MSVVDGTVSSIAVDKDKIHIYGNYRLMNEGPAWVFVYALEPFEDYGDRREEIFSQKLDNAVGEFHIALPRYQNGRDGLYSKYMLGVRVPNDTGITFLNGTRYATELNNISKYDYNYPKARTIKGLQVNMVDDAIQLGIGHAAFNLNLPNIMMPEKNEKTITYHMDGREFYFNEEYLKSFDQRVKALSDHGIIITLILLNSMKWDGVEILPDMKVTLLHPDYDPDGFISAFNVVSKEGLMYYKAFVEFIVERYTRPDQRYGRAYGFIIGNEIDSQWVWCNAGEKTVEQYVKEYAISLRTAFYAARKQYSQARVYISLDHFWTMRFQDNPLRYYRGKDVIDILNRMTSEEGNFDWSIAYHPYPENLFHADFWNDKTAIDSFDTGRITFKNIEVLSRYLSQPGYLYNGRLRHIILSEQGFHSDENEESERLQAAAYCLAYHKISRTSGIDAFILHAHVDNRDEFGLNLGLWRRDKASPLPNAPGSPKPIYYVFKDIDGVNGEDVCRFAKDIIGQDNWV